MLPDKFIFAVQPHDAASLMNGSAENHIVYQLAKRLDVNVELYQCPWARCMQAIKTGEADIIDDLFYSQPRDEFLYFVKPNFEVQTAGFRFYADNTRTKQIEEWSGLVNLRIGMLRGYEHFPRFNDATNLEKMDFLSIEPIIKLILKGRLDAFISPPSFDEKSFEMYDLEKKIKQQPYSYIEDLPLYLGISNKSAWFEHRDDVESALKEVLQRKPVTKG